MSAPATTHDLRCAELRDPLPSGPAPERCTCRPRNVVHLGTSRMCGFCGGLPEFQVGPDERACRAHVGDVLAHFYETGWDGFAPATVVPVAPIRTGGGAA